jgi:predicted porin
MVFPPPALAPAPRAAGLSGLLLAAAAVAGGPALAQSTMPAPAVAHGASDESSVQLYGIVDGGVRHVDQASAAGGLTQFASGLNTSRIGFRGTEFINADLRATFRLEDGFNPGTGTQSNTALFDRTATVGIGWRAWDLRLGRMEGYGYELAASGVTDPLSMALNLPDYSSPAAAGSKAPVLGANPLQALYSYTYGQLRFNNALRLTASGDAWSGGALYALGGVAGDFSADSVKAAHLSGLLGPVQGEGVFEQSQDSVGRHSTLYVLAARWAVLDAWKLQAGIHDLRIGAGFNSSNLGNGASSTGILGSSTTVSTTLATAKEDLHYTVADLGTTWSVTATVPLTLVAYRTHTEGVAAGNSVALVALGKWFLSKRTALYLDLDHAVQSGQLTVKPVSGRSTLLGYTAGINVRF